MKTTTVAVRIVASAIGLTVALASTGWAQAPGDVGSQECQRFQRSVQVEVGNELSRTDPAYYDPLSAVGARVNPAAAAGQITPACANCIFQQFAQGIRIAGQTPCGPAATPTAAPRRTRRSLTPTPLEPAPESQ